MAMAKDRPNSLSLTGLLCSATLTVLVGFGPLTASLIVWDPNRYIDLNEIRPGMEGYCLTCYEGTRPERFGVRVVSIVPKIEPGRDAILVMGTDERFIRTGPVAGCSGSPVYIQDRLAGALAFGWTLSKEPLYGVTPIRQMLQISAPGPERPPAQGPVSGWDFSRPIDLGHIEATTRTRYGTSPVRPVPTTLLVSGMSPQVAEPLAGLFNRLGLNLTLAAGLSITGQVDEPAVLTPGASMMIPLVQGDIRVAVLGTITEVESDKVYAFGHSLFGFGPIELPIATATIHTVVSNLSQSFKIASPIQVVGALTVDDPRGVLGRIGASAKLIPMTVKVSHFNNQPRIFNCRLASHKALAGQLVRTVLSGAAQYFGDLPPDHCISYYGRFELDMDSPIVFSNVSAGSSLSQILSEGMGPVVLMMDNPFGPIEINGIEFGLDISNQNRLSSIYSVEVLDRQVKPGQRIQVKVVLESYPGIKRRFDFDIEVPKGVESGKYNLSVMGSAEYLQFLRRNAPHRLTARDKKELVQALQYLLNVRRDRLYCVLELPSRGLTIERYELPDLPATKALILDSPSRTIPVQTMQPWIEQVLDVGTVTEDKETIKIEIDQTGGD